MLKSEYCQVQRICYIGAGFVGTPFATVMASKLPLLLHTVVDKDGSRIRGWKDGNMPLEEPGLEDLLNEVRNRNLFFSTQIEHHIAQSDVIFICVNTPFHEDVSCSMPNAEQKISDSDFLIPELLAVLKTITKAFTDGTKIIVEKSTVPLRTAHCMKMFLKKHLDGHQNFTIISNPEFCAEGNAINDLLHPDRIVLGCDQSDEGERALKSIEDLYLQWVSSERICRVSSSSAELSKLACNAFLAQRVSSINSISLICEKLGGDVGDIVNIMRKDLRIGQMYLDPSLGFGGSCLIKDLCWLVYLCRCNGLDEVADYWQQVLILNQHRTANVGSRILTVLRGIPKNHHIVTIYGVTFKKNTNDTRDSASIVLIKSLLNRAVKVNVYDPTILSDKTSEILMKSCENPGDLLRIYSDPYEATGESAVICICTEWDEFKRLDYKSIYKKMKEPRILFDGRRLLNRQEMMAIGFCVFTVGSLDPHIPDRF